MFVFLTVSNGLHVELLKLFVVSKLFQIHGDNTDCYHCEAIILHYYHFDSSSMVYGI